MIYSSIDCDINFPKYPKAINKALAFLKENDFSTFEPGVYEIQGKEIYATLAEITTVDASEKRAEAHDKFLDIQFLISGKESIGVLNNTGKYQPYEIEEERDLKFYKNVENEVFLDMQPGYFCVLFPDDIHRPGVINGESMKIRKFVVKISVDLL